jgi:type IV pilus assembly protein PilW
MNGGSMHNLPNSGTRQRGYSLIEVTVAMAVTLFLLGGMFTVLQSTRRNSGNQNVLAQLQDQQRVAMTMLTDVIRQAGYYGSPMTNQPTTAFPVSGPFAAGQSITGGTNPLNAAYGDTITIRYQGDANGVVDCRGATVAAGTTEEMQFLVKPLSGAANAPKTLFCVLNGNDIALVPNVESLTVTYGADVSNSGAANAYLPASQMGPYWFNVYSVKLTVAFTNPLYGQPGQTLLSQKTVSFNRVVAIMANAGVNTFSFN